MREPFRRAFLALLVIAVHACAFRFLLSSPPPERPHVEAVINAVSSSALLAPGAWAFIEGSGFPEEAYASAVPLPTRLAGLTVTFAGRAAPLLRFSSTEIMALIPFELEAEEGAVVPVVVEVQGTESEPYYVRLSRQAPAIFTRDGSPNGPALVFDGNFKPLPVVNPDQVIVLYAAGLGPVNPPAPSARGAELFGTLHWAVDPVEVYVGDQKADVEFAGLAPGFPGVYQLNVRPAEVLTGRLFIRAGGWQSNIATIGAPEGQNVRNVAGSIWPLYPPREGPADHSPLFEAAAFEVSADLEPGAKPFTVAAVSGAGSSIIRIDPQTNRYEAFATTPDNGPRVGDFSGVNSFQVFDLLTCAAQSPCRRFEENQVPIHRFDENRLSAQNLLPAPTARIPGSATGVVRSEGSLPMGRRLVLNEATAPLAVRFGGFMSVPFGPFPRINDRLELWVDGRRVASRPVTQSVINLYSPPPIPRPAPGEVYLDAVFGTQVLRATGPDQGPECVTVYSIWPALNADSSALLVVCDPESSRTEWIVHLDPSSFRVVSWERVPVSLTATAGSEWSRQDPAKHYFIQGNRIAAYNIKSRSVEILKDFTSELGPGHLFRLTMSDDDDVFCFVRQAPDYSEKGFAVWRRSDRRILFSSDIAGAKPELDGTGRYVTLMSDRPEYDRLVIDIATGKREYLTDGEPDFAPGHGDLGAGTWVAWENWRNRILWRRLADPHRWLELFRFPHWSQEIHIALAARAERWATVSTSTGWNGLVFSGCARDEVFQVATDGSGRLRQLAHTYNDQLARGDVNYYDTPRASISFDGRFVAFTSNWGSPHRRDVFVIRVPED